MAMMFMPSADLTPTSRWAFSSRVIALTIWSMGALPNWGKGFWAVIVRLHDATANSRIILVNFMIIMIFCKINIISLDLHAFRAKSVEVGVKK